MQTVEDIRALLQQADEQEFQVLERALAADARKGVAKALEAARKRLQAQAAEREHTNALYSFQAQLAHGGVVLGLDEVGRGPLAGPLTVGGVILPETPQILGLDDSKQLSPRKREELSAAIKDTALAWTVQHVPPQAIDEDGMAAALRKAFSQAIASIEAQGAHVDRILLDGNPLHLDPRELNVVKGDGRCASIAAASIIAKVARDALMDEYALRYPSYDLESCKGYGSAKHMEAIRAHGLTPIHRRSFCHFYEQERLF